MAIDRAQVRHVARLAHLALSPEEEERHHESHWLFNAAMREMSREESDRRAAALDIA